jgi:hypothetical protein
MLDRPRYATGEPVQLGDLVDVGRGNGPKMRVVVVIPMQEAAAGFDASEWEYLKRGVVLQDPQVFGLLHLEELDEDCQRVQAV